MKKPAKAAKSSGRRGQTIVLRGRNRDIFMQALLDPPPPSPKLVCALRRYRAMVRSSQRKP